VVALVEATVWFVHPMADMARNNFLEYRFGRQEDWSRLYVEDKLKAFAHSAPTILQTGDSSGLHGVQPAVVESMFPGSRYVNLNVNAGLGYSGYYEMARYVLERNHSVKVLILYVTPADGQPWEDRVTLKGLMGGDIQREFNSAPRRWLHLPSLSLRQEVNGLVGRGSLPIPGEPLNTSVRYLTFRQLIGAGGGWLRELDNPGDVQPESVAAMLRVAAPLYANMSNERIYAVSGAHYGLTPAMFDWKTLSFRNMLDVVLDSFRTLAADHGAQLVVALNPISERFRIPGIEEQLQGLSEKLAAYQRGHPEVGIIDSEYWPDAKFSSPYHVATPFALENSVRLAKSLKRVVTVDVRSADDKEVKAENPMANLEMANNLSSYGFAEPETLAGRTTRSIRAGRWEALLYARLDPAARTIRMAIGPEVPDDIRKSTTLTINGKEARRLPDETSDGESMLVWAAPAALAQYSGWIEMLVSTRGRQAWVGGPLDEAATGPLLAIAHVDFTRR
jgi:hypothetical protein